MNKLYDIQGKIIGYNSDEINTADTFELFKNECEEIRIKLDILGVQESDKQQYYFGTASKYRIHGLEIRDGIPYFPDTDIIWQYKPESCRHMFNGCKAKSLDLSLLDTTRTKDTSCMFAGCEVESLDLSSFDTINVKSMYEMFNGCTAKSLNLSSLNTEHAIDMSYMFAGCEAELLDLSSFNTSNTKSMHEMFQECKPRLLDISSFSIDDDTDIYGMFFWCRAEHIRINQQAFEKIYNHKKAFNKSGISRDIFKDICEIV